MVKVLFALLWLGLGSAFAAPSPPSYSGSSFETTGTMLRNSFLGAQGKNPVDNPPHLGAIPWAPLIATSFPASSAVVAGTTYFFGGHFYYVQVGGTTAAGGGPTTCPYNSHIASNTVRFVCHDRLWQAGAVRSVGANNFRVRVAGTPALSTAATIVTAAWVNGVVTVTTAAPHGLVGTAAVTIAGETPAGYNGTYTVQVTGASTYTYTLAANPGAQSVAGTSTPAGPGASPVSGVYDGAMIWDYAGRITGPTITQTSAHNAALTVYHPVAASVSATPPSLIPATDGSVWGVDGGYPAVSTVNGANRDVVILGPETGIATVSNCWAAARPLGIEPACNYSSWETLVETAGTVEIATVGTSSALNFIVDDQYLTPDPYISGYGGALNYYTLDFTNLSSYSGGRRQHKIRVEAGFNQVKVNGIYMGPQDQAYYPKSPDNWGYYAIGTSLTAGANASGGEMTFPVFFKFLAGAPKVFNAGEGGTGLLNPGATTNYIGHAALDLAAWKTYYGQDFPIKLVTIEGFVNDIGAPYTTADIVTNIAPLVASIRSQIGSDALIVAVESPAATYNLPTAIGVCTISGAANTVSYAALPTGTGFGTLVVSSGSGYTEAGTKNIIIKGVAYPVANVSSTTAATLSIPVVDGNGVYSCYANNPNASQYTPQVAIANEFARLAQTDPMIKYVRLSTNLSLGGIPSQGTGGQVAIDGSCSATGSGSTSGAALVNRSGAGVHWNNCGYRSFAYWLLREYQDLLFHKTNGVYDIP